MTLNNIIFSVADSTFVFFCICDFVQVGNPYSDHSCWQRPEDMTTDRTAYKIDASRPGSDVAGETAAALAAASIAFRGVDRVYSARLLRSAQQVNLG